MDSDRPVGSPPRIELGFPLSKQSFSAARIQLTVLSLIASLASAAAGAILLVAGLAVDSTGATFGMDDLAVLGAFTVTGVGVLLVAFAMFVVGVAVSLLKVFRALEE